MDALINRICSNRYHIMYLKDPDYFILIITMYGTLVNLEGPYT